MDKRVRVDDAIKRLHVSPEQVKICPPITSFIRTNIKGGLRTALKVMRMSRSTDEAIETFLSKYDEIPESDRENLPWEAIVVATGIDVNHLLGAIQFALQQSSVTAVKFIALSHYPSIIKKQVEFAKERTGERDRAALNQALGFTPSPKGPTFIGKAVFGAGKVETDEEEEQSKSANFSMEDDLDKLFPSATSMQNRLVPIRQRMLENGDDSQ